ncbi:hypothetical protein C6497_16165 [Candidatus Poribacteria bacterium]|nr:MAG: hypothetical protein C6497_16165 [Candidatus Poribacteria bacterium]
MYYFYRFNMFLFFLLTLTFLHIHPSDLFASEQQAPDPQGKSAEQTVLSKESAQLLEKIENGVVDYNEKLKSGKMTFSITQSIQSSHQPQNAKKVMYEDVGTWHITYNFDAHRHFYDVRMYKKMEFNGKPLPNWTDKRYQFQIDDKKMLIREKKETVWIQYPQPTDKSIFRSEFNPRRWGWNPGVFSFTSLIKYAPPIKVEQVEVDRVQLYLLTLYRVRNEKSSIIQQLWIDPRKGYRPTRSLKTTTQEAQTWISSSDGTLAPQQPEELVFHIHSTFQIEQFAPGIWFPRTGIYESSYDPTKQQGFRKTTMQVHKAIFNISIDEKDLSFSD